MSLAFEAGLFDEKEYKIRHRTRRKGYEWFCAELGKEQRYEE